MRTGTIALLFSFCTVFSFCSIAQNYKTGKRVISFTDPDRSGRVIPTNLYYPADVAGNDVALASGTASFPVVVFGHGFVIPTSSYTWLADSLVKYGYILALPSTEGSFSPSHANFGGDLAFLCKRITSLNDSVGSFLFRRVIKKSAVGGHSMGGGCSFLAMSYNPSIDAIFNFAAAETNPSAKNAALTVNRPALVFSGSRDCIVNPTEQQAMFGNIPYTCKSYINITNGLHCHFANNNGTCSFGELATGCSTSSINAAVVFNKVCAVLIPFLNNYVKSDCRFKNDFLNAFNTITGVTTSQVCTSDPLCVTVTSFTFTGKGNWSTKENWLNNLIPPNPLPSGSSITIDPAADGECVLDLEQTISKGASIEVKQGKKLRLPQHLIIN